MTRLLLVEDDPTSRGFLRAAAAALPAHVDVAGSVADARVMAEVIICQYQHVSSVAGSARGLRALADRADLVLADGS